MLYIASSVGGEINSLPCTCLKILAREAANSLPQCARARTDIHIHGSIGKIIVQEKKK